MKPILFNTEMVRAILEGRKLVTRRCIKTVPNDFIFEGWKTNTGNDESYGECMFFKGEDRICAKPKYLIGDILYVRETWSTHYSHESNGQLVYIYKADDSNLKTECLPGETNRWYPSIHMPKQEARLFLKVKEVRVERLSNMLGNDCAKEGIQTFTKDGVLKKYAISEKWWTEFHRRHKRFEGTSWQDMPISIFEAFSLLWNSTIKKNELDQFGWDTNPRVFVYEFEVINKECEVK